MTDRKETPASGILAGPHIEKRKDGASKPERTDDPGPGRDDRDDLQVEIDQAKERAKK